MEYYDMITYGEVQVCERNGGVHTYGNNENFPGCGGCHCCSEHGSTTSLSTDIELKKTTTFHTTDSGTKTTLAEFLTSTSNSQNESLSWSHNYTTAQLKQLMQEELREMSEKLRVQRNLTSAWIRARRSADDQRITSVGMGYVAIGIIAMPFVLVFVSDCRKRK
ncbi:unnamed protein product [Mytilus edulis]|uniref:Uncharacterized protein n=1 Tax=Mytilus edulis TaxID=6550 RepID=A0A8S3T3Z9_MYTED|nr:unnamed protein product [Mytilus edulis]